MGKFSVCGMWPVPVPPPPAAPWCPQSAPPAQRRSRAVAWEGPLQQAGGMGGEDWPCLDPPTARLWLTLRPPGRMSHVSKQAQNVPRCFWGIVWGHASPEELLNTYDGWVLYQKVLGRGMYVRTLLGWQWLSCLNWRKMITLIWLTTIALGCRARPQAFLTAVSSVASVVAKPSIQITWNKIPWLPWLHSPYGAQARPPKFTHKLILLSW